MIKILIVDDEQAIANLIFTSLTRAGYQCECCYDGLEAADRIEQNRYDLVLLDVMLPGADGFEVMEYIREYDIPVIFLTAKSKVEEKVKGLRLGAEDYIVKPFEIIELIARVETVLRRRNIGERVVEIGGIEIDTISHTVKKKGEEILLTNKEYQVLLFFIQNRNIALFREVIYERIWERPYEGDSRTVDLHVQRVKKKVGWDDKIKSIYKVGYRLEI